MENTYVFYISNYREGNAIVTTETRLYSVPISESDAEYALTEPVIKTQMSKAGSFEFSITPQHPYYDKWLQMKTIMRVTYASVTIFRGRVLTIDNSPMNGTKKIHLEGDFAFLLDSVQEGIKDDDRTEKSLETYLAEVINAHNSQMGGENYKKIYLGNAPGNYDSYGTPGQMRVKGDTKKYEETNWRTTSDVLSSLQSQFGGYFRTRYNENDGKCYLDWLDKYFNPTVNTQHIEITENLIDLSSVTEVENLFTVLVPVGSKEGKNVYLSEDKKYVTVPEVAQWYRDNNRESELSDIYHTSAEYFNAISNYGTIYKTQSFSNADTPEKLQEYAYDWVKNNFVGGIDSFTVTALDIRHIDPNKQAFFCGDLVPVVYPNANYAISGGSPTVEKTLALTSIQYNPHNPAQNSYEIGIPNSEIKNKTYGTSTKKSAGGGSSANAAVDSTEITATGGGMSGMKDDISQKAWDFIVSKTYNNPLWKPFEEKYPQIATLILKGTHVLLTANRLVEEAPTTWGEKVRTVLLDGVGSFLEFRAPNQTPEAEMTEEIVDTINGSDAAITIDAIKSLIAIGPKLTGEEEKQPEWKQKVRKLIELNGSNANSEVGLTLFSKDKIQNQNTPESVKVTSGSNKSSGTVTAGRDSNNNWITTQNKDIVWYDAGGTRHEIKGGMHAADYHVDSIGSFKTKFAQIDTLVATKASIQQLEAVQATVGTLDAKIANVETLVASKATLSEVYSSFASSKNVQIGGLVCDTGYFGTLGVGGHTCKWTVLKCKDWTGTNQAYNILIHS